MANAFNAHPRLKWLNEGHVRPYVYLRPDHQIQSPGHGSRLDWFKAAPLIKNPLEMAEVDFADMILRLESRAFAAAGMAMPRWVFYDCAIMPGMVAGFAIHRRHASADLLALLQPMADSEWLPISLFIVIPAMAPGEWVAHNLCSLNALLPPSQRLYGLGFLTKAFGLWFANIKTLCGVTQWASPSIRLHTHFGVFEVLTAYTPVHSHARTLTYRMLSDEAEWMRFFEPGRDTEFEERFESAGFEVDPKDDESLKAFQRQLELNQGRFYLNARQIRSLPLDSALQVYKPKLFIG